MSVSTVQKFNHVSYLWDEKKAMELKGDEVALLIYRSNLLGADLRLTNYGGGNTSCKVLSKDPLTGASDGSNVDKGFRGRSGNIEKKRVSSVIRGSFKQSEKSLPRSCPRRRNGGVIQSLYLRSQFKSSFHRYSAARISSLLNISIICTRMQQLPSQQQKMEKKLHRNYLTER